MNFLGEIGQWISSNESLLSGLAALVVLAGLVLSPIGAAVRRVLKGGKIEPARADEAPIAGSVAATPHAADPSDPLVAVLAFDNLSNDADLVFFSDGVSEEIIGRLSRGTKLKVIGRTSSFQFRGAEKSEAAGRLHCSHVLDGSIRRAGSRVRVSAHLVEAASQTTLWSDRYDRGLEDIFEVQDEIAESIAAALDRTFSGLAAEKIDPETFDAYLRASLTSYAPDELRARVMLLEGVTERAPEFAEAWARLAMVRSWLHFYLPFRDRPRNAARVLRDAERALELDARHEIDALTAQLFVGPPFGHFVEEDRLAERIQRATEAGGLCLYIGWYLRTTGRMREALEEDERAHRLDALNPMAANMLALGRMAAGRLDEAIPIYEELVESAPGMSFPVSSLLRAHAFKEDWAAVDRLLALAERRQLRELEDGLAFIRAKRDPTPERIDAWRKSFEDHVAATGSADVSRLVYAAHLGLVDEAYRAAEGSRLGPSGRDDDVMGPDGYRTSLLFHANMPELRNDPRFGRLCARLGLVEFWSTSGKWPDCADHVPYDFRAECAKVRDVPADPFGA